MALCVEARKRALGARQDSVNAVVVYAKRLRVWLSVCVCVCVCVYIIERHEASL